MSTNLIQCDMAHSGRLEKKYFLCLDDEIKLQELPFENLPSAGCWINFYV